MPELPPCGGYENIVITLDVFSRYLFASRTSKQEAKTIAQVIFNKMSKHGYRPMIHFGQRIRLCVSRN